ncbi:MAG: GTP-binding protein [Oscillospiraceae bacterium]|nr:GTP-binding protein [Oscillospiraceae bacterium]
MAHAVFGTLAHVDAGKTTLSEALLYATKALRRLGRVDHADTFLDTAPLERQRGITIFSKQAVFSMGDREVTLLDTPGHVDFSAEMERVLSVLDAAILVISATDGIQSHTRTLWHLLERHRLPVFLFINKLDLPNPGPPALLAALQRDLDPSCADFSTFEAIQEAAATCDESLLERYLAGETIEDREIAELIRRRSIFPVCYGAALKMEGIDTFLDILDHYTPPAVYPEEFAARVFKIARDNDTRLTFLKVTGGSLKVRTQLSGDTWQEKVNQIRLYSGEKYRAIEEAEAGTVVAVTGLSRTRPGDALGAAPPSLSPALEPVLRYRVLPPAGCDAFTLLKALRQLEEEDPQLRIHYNETLKEIHAALMGEVQVEVLTHLIAERFGLAVTFDEGSIVYKETIAAPAAGVGHFEPLRHYAEVHLLLEPLPPGSGVQYAAACGADQLDVNWQRLILTHLMEKTHRGVLTGAAITDIKLTLIAGRAHVKHTEGGDFRQATYRAVRQGLMTAEPVLLEPTYDYILELPEENVGRAMTDLQRMGATFTPPENKGELTLLRGNAPVSALRGYHTDVAAYTRGRGRLTCAVGPYAPCHNAEEVIAAAGYDPARDTENPADSVFCDHGAGIVVPWSEVPKKAHVPCPVRFQEQKQDAPRRYVYGGASVSASDEELEEIFVRAYGPIRNRGMDALRQRSAKRVTVPEQKLGYVQQEDILLVDGYNIIFAWEDLSRLARESLDAARWALINALSNYQGVKGCQLTLVFDAYRVRDNLGTQTKEGGIHVVYTKEGETADMYIERVSYELSRTHRIKVATSDGLEQILTLGHGAQRLSAADLRREIDAVNSQIRAFLQDQ